jgi:hypothetical protein
MAPEVGRIPGLVQTGEVAYSICNGAGNGNNPVAEPSVGRVRPIARFGDHKSTWDWPEADIDFHVEHADCWHAPKAAPHHPGRPGELRLRSDSRSPTNVMRD